MTCHGFSRPGTRAFQKIDKRSPGYLLSAESSSAGSKPLSGHAFRLPMPILIISGILPVWNVISRLLVLRQRLLISPGTGAGIGIASILIELKKIPSRSQVKVEGDRHIPCKTSLLLLLKGIEHGAVNQVPPSSHQPQPSWQVKSTLDGYFCTIFKPPRVTVDTAD